MSEKRIRFSIKQWRQVRGLSQEEMAARIGVHPNTYRKMESDPIRIRLITLQKICEVLKVSSSDIIVDTEKEK